MLSEGVEAVNWTLRRSEECCRPLGRLGDDPDSELPRIQALFNNSKFTAVGKPQNEITLGFTPNRSLALLEHQAPDRHDPSAARISAQEAIAFAKMNAKYHTISPMM